MEANKNPRNLREKYQLWIGKKVNVGLTTLHYLCGRWKAIDGYDAVFDIGDKEMRIRLHEIDNVADAVDAQVEYFK